ncbi:TolC family protein [Pseudaquabacterium terrae]|uniref:TolC family protein n=1 Tax=Pseudaquabacterium terrae TaxID=2732868 RepID=UPI0031B62D6F
MSAVALLILGALAAGCAAPPQRDQASALHPPLAEAWQRAPGDGPARPADAQLLAQWWRGIGDPLLGVLIDEALVANLDLRSAQAALARARALRDVAAAGQRLQVGSSGSAGRNRSNERNSTSLSLNLDASWEPDAFGGLAAGVAAAVAQAESSAMNLAATRIAVAGEVALAYLQWHGTRRQIRLAEDNLALQAESLQVAQWRSGAGLATVLDVEQARSNVEQTRARLPALRSTLQQTEHRLALLLGQPPTALGERLAQQAPGVAALPALPPLPALGLPADLLRRRPDIRAAEASASAALATLRQREAERLPRFSITGRLGLQALKLAALGEPAALVAGLSAAIQWPALDGGAGHAQVEAQQAALDGARVDYQAAVLTAQQDVENTLAALAAGREQVTSLESAAASAADAASLARLRYQSGLIDFTPLLDAQRSALAADDALASARTELALNQVRLYKALGGGWEAPALPTTLTHTNGRP